MAALLTCHRGMDRPLHERIIKLQWFFSTQEHTCQPWVAVAIKLGKWRRQFLLWVLIFISINSGTYWKWIWGQKHDWSPKAPIDQIRKKCKAPRRWKCIPLFIKDRNGVDLTEAEDVKKRWQDYTEELYKKDLHDPDNHDGVITHLEPDVLEWEVKWASGSIAANTASGGDGVPGELFKILRDDAVKVLHSICHQIWRMQQWPQDWKRSVFIPIPKKGDAKECSNYHTVALISHASRVCSKFSKAGFNSMWIENFQMFKLDLEKAEEPEIRLSTSIGS